MSERTFLADLLALIDQHGPFGDFTGSIAIEFATIRVKQSIRRGPVPRVSEASLHVRDGRRIYRRRPKPPRPSVVPRPFSFGPALCYRRALNSGQSESLTPLFRGGVIGPAPAPPRPESRTAWLGLVEILGSAGGPCA